MAVAAGVDSAGRDGGVCVHAPSWLEVECCVAVADRARDTAGSGAAEGGEGCSDADIRLVVF